MVKLSECSSNMFWGVTIDAGKKYSQTVKQAFHVSMAALDLNGRKTTDNVQVLLQQDSSEFLLCTLNDKVIQQNLDLNFETGEDVSFSLNGSGTVHLTGFVMAAEDDDDDDEDVSFDESDDEEVPSLVETPDNSFVAAGNKRKKLSDGSTPKKMKLSTSAMLDAVDSEDDDDDEDDEDFSDDFDEDEFEDDSDVDSEDEEEDGEEEEEEQTPAKKTKSPAGTPQSQKSIKNTPKQNNKQETPASNKSQTPSTPATPENGESAKKKKKKKKKNKNNDGDSSLNDSTASTPAQTPKADTTTPKKKVVAGGTVVEDLKVGHGPEAKPGKMVSVYYVGTLAKNQKRFDSCQGGKPFRFRLNQGEVIKGWDNGVNGMKVGGKRKITVPASQGYGNMKQGPIPPNSTLVFEVELKAVN